MTKHSYVIGGAWMDEVTVRNGVGRVDWDAFVAGRGTPFHRRAWLGVLASTQSAALRMYGFYAGGEMVGAAPVLIRRLGPIRVVGSPLLVEGTPYLGPVVERPLLAEALAMLRSQVHASFLRFLLPPGPLPVLPGYRVTAKHTHRLDLTVGSSPLWEGLEGRCRTAVRKAMKSGVTVHWPEDGIGSYYQLVQGVYARQGRQTPNPPGFYALLWREARPLVSLVLAHHEGKPIAGALLAHDERCVYYIDGASDYEYRSLNASNLVLWKAVEWAAETGRQTFDFVGSDIDRLARFKASFGGQLVEHACVEWASIGAIWPLRQWYGSRGKRWLARLGLGRG